MVEPLLIETFKYGRLDLVYGLRDLKKINMGELLLNEIDYFDGWEWRLFHNLNVLIISNEAELINDEPEKFLLIFDYLEKVIDAFERNSDFKDRKLSSKNLDYFLVVVYCLLKDLKHKLNIYNEGKKLNKIVNEFNKKFKNYLTIIKKKNFYLHNFSPFEETKWTSKWKFIYEEKEFILKNIDVYIDTYFYNPNIYYKQEMNENIKCLYERLIYLKQNTELYYSTIITFSLQALSERIFFTFSLGNIYNNYRYLILLGEDVFIPEIYKTKQTSVYWFFSVLPKIFVAFLLGYPVVSSGEPEVKNMVGNIDLFSEDKDKYYKNYSRNIADPFIRLKSFKINCGNSVDENEIIDLSFNEVNSYNIDDIFINYNNGVNHIFTSPEFDNLIQKQSNPYNRCALTNYTIIKENLNFKNKLSRKLKNRGVDINLSAPLKEIYQELKEKIDKEKDFSYSEEVNNSDFPFYLTNFLNGITA